MSVQWLPKGFHTITPNIIVDNAEEAIAFLKKALAATENYRLTMADGTIAHCELKIGDSTLNLGTSMEGWPAHGLVAQIYVESGVTCVPVALNSGLFWPRRTFMRYPGTLVVEFLDPLPPGLSRREFLKRVSDVIEEATNRLVEATRREQAQLFGRVPGAVSAKA